MKPQLNISATDQYPLPAFLFEPAQAAKGAILLCPGLGIPKEYYLAYCQFLAAQGYVALVFDYRGIGQVQKLPTDQEINLRNWGIKDMPGALNCLANNYPQQKIYLFGHSIAGQVAGLMYNHPLVDRFVFISATGGYHRVFDFPLNIFTWFMFHLHIPITTRLFGYMPKSLTYRGVSIAKGVALEWAEWSRQKNYIAAFLGKKIPENYYAAITQKIDWLWFADDAIATDRALESIMSYYTQATINKHPFDPQKLGISRIGHAGFFSPRAKQKLWRYPLDLIEAEDV